MSGFFHPAVLVASTLVFGFACSRPDRPRTEPIAEPRAASTSAPDGSGATTEPRPTVQLREQAILAGGCFWGMEELLRKQPGVIATTVGYTGGSVESPAYRQVASGDSGHAESIRVEFDPQQTSYEQLLFYFFTIHDPTTQNRQGNDVGSQYRSAIFVQNDQQRAVAERVKRRVAASRQWHGTITTEIVKAGPFYPAEDYHQDYLKKNPGGYTCHYERDLSF